MVSASTAVSASHDRTLRVWDVASGRLIAVYPCDSEAYAVAAAADGRFLAGTASGQLHFLTLVNAPALGAGLPTPPTQP